VIYENEEFHLLQSALNIEDGQDGLRYNKVVIGRRGRGRHAHPAAADFRFSCNSFLTLFANSHLYILDTPLFRVRNKKRTIYCYSEQEKEAAIAQLGASHESLDSRGSVKISAGEFKDFIGENIRLEPVI